MEFFWNWRNALIVLNVSSAKESDHTARGADWLFIQEKLFIHGVPERKKVSLIKSGFAGVKKGNLYAFITSFCSCKFDIMRENVMFFLFESV